MGPNRSFRLTKLSAAPLELAELLVLAGGLRRLRTIRQDSVTVNMSVGLSGEWDREHY